MAFNDGRSDAWFFLKNFTVYCSSEAECVNCSHDTIWLVELCSGIRMTRWVTAGYLDLCLFLMEMVSLSEFHGRMPEYVERCMEMKEAS